MKSVKKVILIVVGVILALVLVAGGIVFYFGHNLYQKTNYTPKTENMQQTESEMTESESETVLGTESMSETAAETETETEVESESATETEYTTETETGTETETEIVKNDKIFNIMLVGVDRRDNSWNGNSDSMMLLSINEDAECMNLVSLMRDTYVDIPGSGMQKLNAAYAIGGGDLLLETIQENYKVAVERYITVDFKSMMDIVDQIGAINIYMSEAEVEVANGYMRDMCNQMGIDVEPYLISGSGNVSCNGMRAVAYARIRYVGHADYERTARQREVLTKLLENVRKMGILDIYRLAEELLAEVTHNIPADEFLELLLKVGKFIDYDLIQDRIPYDNMYSVTYVKGQDMLVPDWEATLERLHTMLYDPETYQLENSTESE